MMHEWSTMKRLIYLRGNPATGGGGGSPLTVSGPTPLLMPGALAKPMRAATFAISPVQAGAGDPSPQNVRAITGYQSMTAWVTGRNLLDPESPNHWVISSGYVKQYDETNRSMVIPCKQGDKYTISCQRKSGSGYTPVIYYAFADEGRNILSRSGTSGDTTLSGTAPANTAYLYAGASHVTDGMDWVQLEGGSTATPYAPYSGMSVNVTFPASVGTVYSGTIDPVTGQGVVDYYSVMLDGINYTMNVASTLYIGDTTTRSYCVTPNVLMAYSNDNAKISKCDKCVYVNSASAETGVQAYLLTRYEANNRTEINVRLLNSLTGVQSSDTTVEAKDKINAYLSEHPVHIIFKLSTPIPFTVTPQSLTPPAGDAYIWADCGGSAEVTYIGKT